MRNKDSNSREMVEHKRFVFLVCIVLCIGLGNIWILYGSISCNHSHVVDASVDINIKEYTIERPVQQSSDNKFSSEMIVNEKRMKTIYVHGNKEVKEGSDIFHKLQCAVKTCHITSDENRGKEADLVIFGYFSVVPKQPPFHRKSREQIWMIQILEAPGHEPNFEHYNGLVNWTMTYRSDSTLQFPYFKFKYWVEPRMRVEVPNFALGKTKKVAWLCSNLSSKLRNKYFSELKKYIQADRIGQGAIRCPYNDMYHCLQKLQNNYKFYFAAENMYCNEYMTEKVGRNSYRYQMIPIVLGARREDYVKRLPPNSYIFAEDFQSPKHLAEYLHKIDQNDTMYNEFFQYRKMSYVEEEFSPPWCDLCKQIHEHVEKPSWYNNIKEWWRNDSCRKPPWHIIH